MGAFVSFTAVAGQEPLSANSLDPAVPAPAIPTIQRLRLSSGLEGMGNVQVASLTLGEKADLLVNPDEIEPRRDIKKGVRDFPAVDRSRRSDPLVGLRPTLDTNLMPYSRFERAR